MTMDEDRTFPWARRAPVPTTMDDEEPIERWDESPRRYAVNGVYYEFFLVGALAKALGRSPTTIRAWESWGVLPRSPIRTPRPKNVKGGSRLYTRRWIEGILQIAIEEGVVGAGKVGDFSKTNFTARVKMLMQSTPLGPEDAAR